MAIADILYGPVSIWYAPVGESLPADSVAVEADWGGNWKKIAYTKAPLSMNYEIDELEIMVEQELTAVKRVKTGERAMFETVLAEVTSAYLALATSGTATTTAAGAGQVGKDELVVGGGITLDEYAWGFEGQYVSSDGTFFPVRLFIYKATAMLNGALEHGKESYAGIPLQVKALVDTTKAKGSKLFKFQRVTVAAS